MKGNVPFSTVSFVHVLHGLAQPVVASVTVSPPSDAVITAIKLAPVSLTAAVVAVLELAQICTS